MEITVLLSVKYTVPVSRVHAADRGPFIDHMNQWLVENIPICLHGEKSFSSSILFCLRTSSEGTSRSVTALWVEKVR